MSIWKTMGLFMLLVATGCRMLDFNREEFQVLSERQITAFAGNRVRDPRTYGLRIGRGPQGTTVISNAFRQRPRHAAETLMLTQSGRRVPVIQARVTAFKTLPMLLDPSSALCWTDYAGYEEMELVTLGMDGQAFHVGSGRDTGGVPAFVSLRRQLMIEQLFVDELLFMTLMQRGGPGPLARGLSARAVLGWELLRTFSAVQFDFPSGTVRLFSDQLYQPDERMLLGRADLLRNTDVCVVEGGPDGAVQRFILDPAGDFEVAWPGYEALRIPVLLLGDMVFANVRVSPEPVEGSLPRIGGRLLERYRVTICPGESRIWFEAPVPVRTTGAEEIE